MKTWEKVFLIVLALALVVFIVVHAINSDDSDTEPSPTQITENTAEQEETPMIENTNEPKETPMTENINEPEETPTPNVEVTAVPEPSEPIPDSINH